ncbi:MAG: hypothetical protein II879_13925 [Clostridia bacterium]|nr:hypothetical protein [Clostridia bacterium]
MNERYTHRYILKISAGICLLAVLLFLLTGCGAGSVFDGSRIANASEFQMEYSVLDREETTKLELRTGDQLQVTLSHTTGTVDVTVGLKGKEPIYRGNGQQNAEFMLVIDETGNYQISVSGHQAKGSISFTRIPGQ